MLPVKKNERLSVNFRDLRQRAPENGLLFLTHRLFGRQQPRRRSFADCIERFRISQRFTAFAAQTVVDPVAGDAAEPGAQLRRLAQMPEMFPGSDEGFLGEVLALAEAAGGAVSQGT